MADVRGELTGRVIQRVVVDDESWKAGMVERGVPPAADVTLGLRAARAGASADADPMLETDLVRPAASVRKVLTGVVPAV